MGAEKPAKRLTQPLMKPHVGAQNEHEIDRVGRKIRCRVRTENANDIGEPFVARRRDNVFDRLWRDLDSVGSALGSNLRGHQPRQKSRPGSNVGNVVAWLEAERCHHGMSCPIDVPVLTLESAFELFDVRVSSRRGCARSRSRRIGPGTKRRFDRRQRVLRVFEVVVGPDRHHQIRRALWQVRRLLIPKNRPDVRQSLFFGDFDVVDEALR